MVADYYGLTKLQLVSKTRTKNIATARHMAMYLCRKHLDMPYVKIGDEIYAKVVDVDNEDNHLKLSIKDIDYKNDGSKLERMEETKNGFKPLKDNLEIWITEKIKEITNKM